MQFLLKRAEDTIPHDQDAAIIPVNIDLILCVMNTMVRRRYENFFHPAEISDVLCMDPELINQVKRVNCDEDLQWHAKQEQWQVKHPAEQKAAAGLSQCC